MSLAAAIVLSVLAVLALGIWKIRSAFRRHTAEYDRRRAVEYQTKEDAPWFGRTGLSDEDERELPRYLRREFGEFLDEPHALRAADLEYLGVQADERGRAHFWKISRQSAGATYAFIDIDEAGKVLCFDWGGREPPAVPNAS